MHKQEIYNYIKQNGELLFAENCVNFDAQEQLLIIQYMDTQELEVYAHTTGDNCVLIIRSCTGERFTGSSVKYITANLINEIFYIINSEFGIYEEDEFIQMYERTI